MCQTSNGETTGEWLLNISNDFFLCVCMLMHICMCAYVYMEACVSACLGACMYVHVYVCVCSSHGGNGCAVDFQRTAL